MKRNKILWGIVLLVIGGIFDIKALFATEEIPTGFGGTMTVTSVNMPLFVLAIIITLVGGVLLVWGYYEWSRRKAVEVIAEGMKKAQEREKNVK